MVLTHFYPDSRAKNNADTDLVLKSGWNTFLQKVLILRREQHISQKKLGRVTYFAHVVDPAIAVTFVTIYWTVGVYSYLYPGAEFVSIV